MATTLQGHRFGWNSVSLGIDGIDEEDFTDISYDWETDAGEVRAKGSRLKGFTRGEDKASGSLTMLKAREPKFLAALKAKYGSIPNARPTFTISYREEGEEDIITDVLEGVKLTKGSNKNKTGTEALMVTYDLKILRLNLGGVDPHANKGED